MAKKAVLTRNRAALTTDGQLASAWTSADCEIDKKSTWPDSLVGARSNCDVTFIGTVLLRAKLTAEFETHCVCNLAF